MSRSREARARSVLGETGRRRPLQRPPPLRSLTSSPRDLSPAHTRTCTSVCAHPPRAQGRREGYRAACAQEPSPPLSSPSQTAQGAGGSAGLRSTRQARHWAPRVPLGGVRPEQGAERPGYRHSSRQPPQPSTGGCGGEPGRRPRQGLALGSTLTSFIYDRGNRGPESSGSSSGDPSHLRFPAEALPPSSTAFRKTHPPEALGRPRGGVEGGWQARQDPESDKTLRREGAPALAGTHRFAEVERQVGPLRVVEDAVVFAFGAPGLGHHMNHAVLTVHLDGGSSQRAGTGPPTA